MTSVPTQKQLLLLHVNMLLPRLIPRRSSEQLPKRLLNMLIRTLALLTALLALTSCASGTAPTVVQPTLVQIPDSLTYPCPPLPRAKDAQLGSLLANHVEVARAYHLCAGRQAALVDAIRGQKGVAGNP